MMPLYDIAWVLAGIPYRRVFANIQPLDFALGLREAKATSISIRLIHGRDSLEWYWRKGLRRAA